jgi:hypothetical protein
VVLKHEPLKPEERLGILDDLDEIRGCPPTIRPVFRLATTVDLESGAYFSTETPPHDGPPPYSHEDYGWKSSPRLS